MRVIAGAAKGHKLETIEGLETRPTTDRIKETLFNIIAFDLPECHFLDLFAGSGAIGIEALSRGADEAIFVEQAGNCLEVIQRNLQHTKLQEKARVLRMDALAALEKLAAEGKRFDIIFVDPPYESGLYETVCNLVLQKGLLTEKGYLVAEHSSQLPMTLPVGMRLLREKTYKTTVLTFLCPEDEE